MTATPAAIAATVLRLTPENQAMVVTESHVAVAQQGSTLLDAI
jgi:hypothetical protein